MFDKCYKCAGKKFYRNEKQVRCAKCGGFHCLPSEFHGALLSREEVHALQKEAAQDNKAQRLAA